MSKGNLFLGQARGSVGDVTFTHTAGVQVARARNRSPKNPQSVLQMVTRIIQSSASKAYSMFRAITDHSFQGEPTGTPNQSRFMQLNTAMLRMKLASLIAEPSQENAVASVAWNFNFKGESLPVFNQWIVSAGTLPQVPVTWLESASEYTFGPQFTGEGVSPVSLTYGQVIEALHAKRGDQLTFLAIANDPSKVGDFGPTIDAFEFARVILDPAEGDLTTPFLSGQASPFAVNAPNERNEGLLAFGWHSGALSVASLGTLAGESAAGTSRWIQGLAVILSRRVGDTWERSPQSFVIALVGTHALNWGVFGDAYLSYLRGENASSLYLNQAGV